MKIRLLAVGNKPPAWVVQGFQEYARRFPRDMPLELLQIPASKRHGDSVKFIRAEGEKMLQQLHKGEQLIALDGRGKPCSSLVLAEKMNRWREQGVSICFAVGGADGLAPAVLERADESWSLSALTLPHYLVRVVVAEALYRAWSICTGHPYHRL